MELCINTIKNNSEEIEIALKKGTEIIGWKRAKAKYQQAEKLLPLIDKLLKSGKTSRKAIKSIIVENGGGTFTALRIGVITANALGFALNIPVKGIVRGQKNKPKNQSDFDIVEPIYDREPNIKVKN